MQALAFSKTSPDNFTVHPGLRTSDLDFSVSTPERVIEANRSQNL